GALVEAIAKGAAALAALPEGRLAAAWGATVDAFLDPESPERRALDPALASLCRLSPQGLAAAFEAVLGGVRAEPFAALRAAARERPPREGADRPVLVVLASNLPALAVQPLAGAVALGRPALLKSPSSEPLFAPAFLAALARREPAFGGAYAAATWPGGDVEIETPVLARAGRVLAYGDETALADLERRVPGRVVAYGPKTSFAAIGREVDPGAVAAGLARDVALFDQRGCLSIAAVFTAGSAAELAREIAASLRELARAWPPGPADLGSLGAVRQLRLDAEMRGLVRQDLGLSEGTVVVEPELRFAPSPGLRAVRIHPLGDLEAILPILAPWRVRLQGAALAGAGAEALRPALAALGVSRFAAPGEL